MKFPKYYDKNSNLKNIFTHFGKIEEKDQTVEKFYSQSIVHPKMFFSKTEETYFITGLESLGRIYCDIEFQQITNQLSQKSEQYNISDIKDFKEKIKDIDNLENQIIIGVNVNFTYEIFNNDEDFKLSETPIEDRDAWKTNTGWCGEYKKAPVFEIFNGYRELWRYIIILEKEFLPTLEYFRPNTMVKDDLIGDFIYLKIIDLNENDKRRTQLIDKPIETRKLTLRMNPNMRFI